MENLRLDLVKGTTGIQENDEFYEEIEAPKFVDFTTNDPSRPNDSSWFCVRIGCDQQHEQVDPEALHKSFMLRVMAARSPNLQHQKVLSRQGSRSILNCPQSAPAKSTTDRISRFSTATAIPEKLETFKLRNHPISSLRPTTTPTKSAVRPLAKEKALTTLRAKKCPSNREPFRSVKYQKIPMDAPNHRTVAKTLSFDSPKKTIERTTKPSNHVCDVLAEMKRLRIGSVKKTVPRGRLCTSSRCTACDPNSSAICSKKGEEFTISSKKKIEGCLKKIYPSILQEKVVHGSSTKGNSGKLSSVSFSTAIEEEQVLSSTGSNSKDSLQTVTADYTSSNVSKIQIFEENAIVYSNQSVGYTEIVGNPTGPDDNKENLVNNYEARETNLDAKNPERENLQLDNCENLPQKANKARSKPFQEKHQPLGGKQKRTTNPKPFRLLTDERWVLREANLEKRLQVEAKKETAPVLRCGDGIQNGAKTVRARLAGAKKLVRNNSPQHQKLQKIVKVPLSRQPLKARSVIASTKVPSIRLPRDKETLRPISRVKASNNTTSSTRKIRVPEGL